MLLEFLWRAGQRTGEERYFAAVEITLERICQGGIYDHLGGGFSRYSVDERWLVPHFEKMLYDNAQLLELLALAHGRSGNPLFRTARAGDRRLARARDDDRGRRVLRLARRRLGRRGGQVLRLVARRDRARHRHRTRRRSSRKHYDVTAEGNFEGHTILNRLARVPATPEEETRLADAAAAAARGARQARAPRARRQGAGRLERHDDRRAGQRRRPLRRAVMAADGGARVPVHRRQDDARATGSAIPGARSGCCSPALRPTMPT